MKKLIALFLSLSVLAPSAFAAPSVKSRDVKAKLVEMATDATITDYCVFGKNEENVNFVACSQMVGDLSKGVYRVQTEPLGFAIPELAFDLAVDAASLNEGVLTYVFVEKDIEDPVMKPSTEFFDQVKGAIDTYGAARLELLYIGAPFDSSLFGTPVPLFQ